MANQIDLKLLVLLINDQKDIEANLILDEGCRIEADDQAPLVKVINYFMNYLHAISKGAIQISLDLMGNSCLMSFIGYTDKESIPEFSSNLNDALKMYNAKYEHEHKVGSYVQVKIHFAI
jgi:hypothetical protein